MKRLLLLLILCVFSLFIRDCWASVIDGIAAVINDDIITRSELKNSLQLLKKELLKRENKDNWTKIMPGIKEEEINRLIEERLQLQIAKKRGITADKREVDKAIEEIKKKNFFSDDNAFRKALEDEGVSYEEYVNEIKDQLTIMKLVNIDVWSHIVLKEDEIIEYYKNNRQLFLSPERVRISQILIPKDDNNEKISSRYAREKAMDIVKQLHNGADFEDMAMRYSEGILDKKDSDLGYFTRGTLLPEIEKTAFSLKTGEVDVVETSLGFHIIKVIDKDTSSYSPLEKVRTDIENILKRQKSEQLYQEWLSKLRKNAYVFINFEE
ncbi:MAG: peptidylprolyl isomerase [Nitrospirota bacterium]